MEKYLSGVKIESPQYGGAGITVFPEITLYLNREKTAPYFENELNSSLKEDEEPSDLDEILATCTLKNVDKSEFDEDNLEQFYTDTIPEEETDYLWRTIYISAKQEENIYPLPKDAITDLILQDTELWATA